MNMTSLLDALLSKKVTINKKEYDPVGLVSFFKIEYLRDELTKSLKRNDKKQFLYNFREILQERTKEDFSGNPKEDFILLFEILINNKINSDLVFLKPPPKTPDEKPKPKNRWDYEGRFLVQWINLLAKNYGWTVDYIRSLSIDLAVYFIQELYIDEQFDKEWSYSLSELAYKYDPNTKKSNFVPLSRPYWMQENVDAEIKKIKIPKRLLPYGVTVVSGIETPNAVEYIS